MNWEQIIITLISVLIPSVISFLLGRRAANVEPEKIRADAAKTLANGYASLVTDLREQIEAQESKIDELTVRIEHLDERVKTTKHESEQQSQEFQRRIVDLENQLISARARIEELENVNQSLRNQNHALGEAAEQLREYIINGGKSRKKSSGGEMERWNDLDRSLRTLAEHSA